MAPAMTTYPSDELVARAAAGDRTAMNEVVWRMERTAQYVVRVWRKRTFIPVDELVQEARCAVLPAVRRYHPKKGKRFHNYALLWMTAYLRRLVVRANPNDPRNTRTRTTAGRAKSHGSSRAEAFVSTHWSLDMIAEDDSSLAETLGDGAMSTDEVLAEAEERALVHQAIDAMPQLYKHVLNRRAEGVTLSKVGEEFGVTRERARQVQLEAIRRLKRTLGRQGVAA